MPQEIAFVATPGSFAGARIIASPFEFVSDADTFLRVTSACSIAGVVLAVQGRRLDERGNLQAIVETHTPLATRLAATQDYKVGEGALLNLTVWALQGAPVVGQAYVMLQLMRNVGGTAIVLGTLLAGYVTHTQALGFPGSPIQSSVDGEPSVRFVQGTAPPLGVEIAETVPAGARWELLSAMAILTTDATAVSRGPSFRPVQGGSATAFYGNNLLQTNNAQLFHVWAPNLPSIAATQLGVYEQPMAQRVILRAGDQWTTLTALFQPGDSWGTPFYVVREWLEVP